LEQPIVRYTIILYLIWFLLFIFALKFEKTHAKVFYSKISSKKIELLVIFIYILFTFILLFIGVESFFPYLNAAFLALAIWLTIATPYNEPLPLLLVFMLLLIPYTVVIIYNSYPLGDDARFTAGFATAIANDGLWVPLKYPENDYYQLFHAEPALTFTLASVMRTPLRDIPIYYLTLKYCIYITYILSIYEMIYKLTNNKNMACLSLLLFSITPPLSLMQIVAQSISIIFSLLTLDVLLRVTTNNKIAMYLIGLILATSGTIFHATYVLVISAFLLPLILMKKTQNLYYVRIIKAVLGLTLLISITYWVFTYTGISIFTGIPPFVTNFINFLLGISKPYAASWTPWYGSSLSQYLVSWALLPAIVSSIITYTIIELLTMRDKIGEQDFGLTMMLGILGVMGNVVNFLARQSTFLGGRYFYWLYLLLLPSTAYFLTERFRNKLISTIVMILIVALIGIYGIQDPTHSANTFVKEIGWSDNISWKISWAISSFLSSRVSLISDPRIETPLGTIQFFKDLEIMHPKYGQFPQLLILGMDNIGYRTLLGAESYYGIPFLIEHAEGIVISFGSYNVYYYG
jgi:hypothetical protein